MHVKQFVKISQQLIITATFPFCSNSNAVIAKLFAYESLTFQPIFADFFIVWYSNFILKNLFYDL